MVKSGLQQDEALAAVTLINKQTCRIVLDQSGIISKSFYLISPELYRELLFGYLNVN